MTRVVLLVEEQSAAEFLEGLLPRFLPGVQFQCIPHEGKSDLEKSLPRILRSWRDPDLRFVVLRDNDGADCRALKKRLKDLCRDGRRPGTLVRIVCQELEAWYFGDVAALAEAFEDPRLADVRRKKGLRIADSIVQPSRVLRKLAPGFQKISGARAMGRLVNVARNDSESFQAFVAGIKRVVEGKD